MKTALALLALFFAAPVHAAPLIADLSNYRITMDSTWSGTRLFVFGTRMEGGDVVVAVRGPAKNYVVRKKEEMMGLWINTERVKLFNLPDYYTVAASRPMSEMAHGAIFRELALGEETLFAAQDAGREFTDAFIAHQRARGLYPATQHEFGFMGETLFKTVIEFPDNIPPGAYTAEIYLLDKHRIVGSHTLPIDVRKVGLDAFVYNAAHEHPLLYGLTAVLLALAAGWFAGRLFNRI